MMKIIHEKLERLDQAILDGANAGALRGHIIDIRDHLAAEFNRARDLTTENEILRTELSEATKQNESLKAQLKDANLALEQAAAPKDPKADRPEIEQRILQYISTGKGPTWQGIAQQFSISAEIARYHLYELGITELIEGRERDGRWFLTQEGRRYLMQRSLLQ